MNQSEMTSFRGRRAPFVLSILTALLAGCGGGTSDPVDPPPPPLPPEIGLSATDLEIQSSTLGGNPASQMVTVTNAGTGDLTGLQASIVYGSGQPGGWLEAILDRQTAPATLTVTARRLQLAVGGYDATIKLTAADAGVAGREVRVRFTLQQDEPQPEIDFSKTSLHFESTGSLAPAAQSVAVTNSGGGSLNDLQAEVRSYGANQPTGWLIVALSTQTAPASLVASISPSTLDPGIYNAIVAVSSKSASNSPVQLSVTYKKNGLPAPTMADPVLSGASFELNWSYVWPVKMSAADRIHLEESTVGPTSEFHRLTSFDRNSKSIKLTRTAGAYYYRVQAEEHRGLSELSRVVSVVIGQVTATRFINNTVWDVVSLKIDGKEQFVKYGEGIAPGKYLHRDLATGKHKFEARVGTWIPIGGGYRHERPYVFEGSFEQKQGLVGSILFDDPTIAHLLTRLGKVRGDWSAFVSGGPLIEWQFRFFPNGTFELLENQSKIQSGTFELVTYVRGTLTFKVRYADKTEHIGTFDELNPKIKMQNGPSYNRDLTYK